MEATRPTGAGHVGGPSDPVPRSSARAAPGRRSVSVLVPAFNESRNIGRLLEFVRAEKIGDGDIVQVLVEASGSTDGTQSIVTEHARLWPAISLIDVGRREGLVAAVNRLLERATGDVVVRLDADVAAAPGTIGLLVSPLDDPTVGIVGPQIVGPPRGGFLMRHLASTFFALHDLVSRRSVKSTNVQAFRRFRFRFATEAESEDNILQREITSQGLRAVYERRAVVMVAFPMELGELWSWRIRCIATSRWYRRKYGIRSPTQDAGLVGRALLDGIQEGQLEWFGLASFLGLEALAHASVVLSGAIRGPRRTTNWTPLLSTKSPAWEMCEGLSAPLDPVSGSRSLGRR